MESNTKSSARRKTRGCISQSSNPAFGRKSLAVKTQERLSFTTTWCARSQPFTSTPISQAASNCRPRPAAKSSASSSRPRLGLCSARLVVHSSHETHVGRHVPSRRTDCSRQLDEPSRHGRRRKAGNQEGV